MVDAVDGVSTTRGPLAVRMLDQAGWARLAQGDAGLGDAGFGDAGLDGENLVFYGLFVSGERVFCLFERAGVPELVGTGLVDGGFASVAGAFADAAWFERLAHDLTKAVVVGSADRRAAIAHGAAGSDAGWPAFIETPGEGGFQVGQGPVAGLIAAPVHRRFSLDGGRVVRLEHRLGYAHRGIIGLMRGKSPRVAARYAARITGDATVAHASAFARAAEAVAGVTLPARAAALRAIMLGIERVTGDLAALAAAVEQGGDLRFAVQIGRAREAIAVAVGAGFGHRLMMDMVVPGGLALDFDAAALPALEDGLQRARLVARGFGWARARRDLGAAAPIALARARSVQAMARMVRDMLEVVPAGAIAQPLPAASGMAVGVAESARGSVHHWLDVRDGDIVDAFFIDPSARLLARLEAGVVGLTFEAAGRLVDCYGLAMAAIDG